MHKIVYNKKTNKYWLIDATLTPGDQMWCLVAVVAATTYSDEVQVTKTATQAKKKHSSSMRTAPKQVDYTWVIYNVYANMPYTYATVNGDITISY